ncbi:MAG: SPFH domain-containing protein [Candidatus Riflebacteria bacterium]|nr:SPFH domain-containing protein [Candidatus Riflebacteria bacterium]
MEHKYQRYNKIINVFIETCCKHSSLPLFFKDGQALDLFTAGRYTLDENSIPLLGSFWNKVLGKVLDKDVPFNSEVYFINKVEQMVIKWGTDSKVEYLEPTFNFPLAIGACG